MTATAALANLGRDQMVEVLTYLAQDPIETVFLRGLILRAGLDLGRQHGRFMAYREPNGELGGVILVSSLVVPYATAPEAPVAMAEVLRRSPLSDAQSGRPPGDGRGIVGGYRRVAAATAPRPNFTARLYR